MAVTCPKRVDLDGLARLDQLDQPEEFLAASQWPRLFSQDFEPLKVDGLLTWVLRVSDHPGEIHGVLLSLFDPSVRGDDRPVHVGQGFFQGRDAISQS